MKICVIYGSARIKGSTAKVTQGILEALEPLVRETGDSLEVVEHHLPKDLPHFCMGCFNCFLKGEDTCPHKDFVAPIIKDLSEADGIILSSPVYAMGPSAQMKSLLDHLAFQYIPHRPRPDMFDKVGLVVVTTAGAGIGGTSKLLAKNLKFWGLKRVHILGFPIFDIELDSMPQKRKDKLARLVEKKARAFHSDLLRRRELRPLLFTRFFMMMGKRMMKGYPDDNLDKRHWKGNKWI